MGCIRKFFAVCFAFIFCHCSAQKILTLKEAEELFQKNNLFLLAAHFEIDIAEARTIQARLWENPYVYTEVNAINPQGNKYFDAGRNGQKVMAIQQLVYLGGKKKYEVALAKKSAELASLEFQDLLRNLKYRLRVGYFSIYFDQLTSDNIERQLSNLDSLLASYIRQAEKGNVPYKDIVRLQSLYLTLQNERTTIQNRILSERRNLSILLGIEELIIPAPTTGEAAGCREPLQISLDSLWNLALKNRPDLLAAEKQIEAAQWNLRWQKSLAVPDVSIGASYDQRGGAFNNQINLTLGIPLPLWNRNQGNIKIAEAYIKQTQVNKELQLLELKNEVMFAYNRFNQAYENFQILNKDMDRNFENVYNGVLYNFHKRNISILEFTDFMESYNSSLIQMNEMRKALRESCEEINMVAMQNLLY
jgi:cobalt-zinc-cadmium efflux system outer membrane protein